MILLTSNFLEIPIVHGHSVNESYFVLPLRLLVVICFRIFAVPCFAFLTCNCTLLVVYVLVDPVNCIAYH